MLMSVVSHLLSAWFAFLLPCYATWKALAHRPVSDAELERWGMYWAVVGAFVAFEYVAIWLLSWIPFYWETRTAFLLFLALPQTQGSTYVYVTYMQPFLIKNQVHIDAGIEAAQTNMLAFLQTRFVAFWQTFWDLATKASAPANQTTAAGPQPTGPNPVAIAKGLWSAYSPSLMGAFGAPFNPMLPSLSKWQTGLLRLHPNPLSPIPRTRGACTVDASRIAYIGIYETKCLFSVGAIAYLYTDIMGVASGITLD
ncbi:putative HVA22-like protein g [Grifola frondosa]|uniref:Protein YOP1 n=1 Tax=Grifola frondosa TaxID=5627 RepID=A0A1C7MQQ5_GRIFR|nr:putative HVA22-like protein g [Grifola frondosa]